jgi:hypothetical protein
VAAHLLESPTLDRLTPLLDGDDQSPLEAPRYEPAGQSLYLARHLIARPLTTAAWAYQQGAYRVLQS